MENLDMICAYRYSTEEQKTILEPYTSKYQLATYYFLQYLQERNDIKFLKEYEDGFKELAFIVECDDCACNIMYSTYFFLRNCESVIEPFESVINTVSSLGNVVIEEKDFDLVAGILGRGFKSVTFPSSEEMHSRTTLKGDIAYLMQTDLDGEGQHKIFIPAETISLIASKADADVYYSFYELEGELRRLIASVSLEKVVDSMVFNAFSAVAVNAMCRLREQNALTGKVSEDISAMLKEVVKCN